MVTSSSTKNEEKMKKKSTEEAGSKTKKKITILEDEIVLDVPLAIGTLQWGTTWVDDKIVNSGGVLSEETVEDILQFVRDQGEVTMFDTAEGYGGGTSEKRLGRLLSTKEKEQREEREVLYMTKFLPVPWRFRQEHLVNAARKSCKRLNVETISVYLLHSPIHYRPIEYWVEACATCKKLGLIKSMGLSNCNAEQVERAVSAGKKYGVPVVCNQVHYSLLDYNSESLRAMERACRENNVRIIAFSPIGQGLLTDKLTADNFQGNKPAKMLRFKSMDELDPLRSVIKSMSTKYDKTMAQVAINWCAQHDVVPLVGCRSLQQAKDSVGSLGWSLSPSDVAALDDVALDRCTLDSPPWRRALFVTLFGIINLVCNTLDILGFGSVIPLKSIENNAGSAMPGVSNGKDKKE